MRFTTRLAAYYQAFRRQFSGVPILGPLAYCRWAEHKLAAREMFVILVFATATFWLTAIFLMSSQAARAIGYPGIVHSTVASGELFIFSVGFLGPILLTALDDPKGGKEFPGRLWHIFALIVIGLVATGYHSQIKAAQLRGQLDSADQTFLFEVSVWIAISAVILRYLAMLYRKSTFVPEDEIKKPESDFANDYVKQHQDGLGQ